MLRSMGNESKWLAGVGLATLAVVVGAVVWLSGSGQQGGVGGEEKVAEEELVTEGMYFEGAEAAKVTIVEFSDFECPACGYFNATVAPELLEKYSEDLRVGFRNFPLPQHQESEMAAEAAEAAGAQGKFWEAVRWIFGHQQELSKTSLLEMASELGLDTDRFEKELNEGKYRDQVYEDLREGQKLGVNATPTLYVNGVKYGGELSVEGLSGGIEGQLGDGS
jgi:NhaA family Na+:H+ antiporter